MPEPGMMELLKQARGLKKIQKKAEKREVSAEAGGGLVQVVCNGKPIVRRVLIDQTLLEAGDKRRLQDLVTEAVNAALKKSQDMVAAEFQKVAGDLGLPGGDEPQLDELEEAAGEEEGAGGATGGRWRRWLKR